MLIYKLVFTEGTYVGQTSANLESRVAQHISALEKGNHHSYKVQEAYRMYGLPKASVLEECPDYETLQVREVYWINKLDTFNSGLNCTIGGNGVGFGEDNPSSKYSLDDYCAVVTFLANTDMSLIDVSNELDVSYSVVNNINSGYTHQYLAKVLPEEYTKMLLKKGSRTKMVHSPEIYRAILFDLAYTTDTMLVISQRYGVKNSLVGGMTNGKHPSLELLYPIEYRLMQDKKGSRPRREGAATGKIYPTIVSPSGEEFANIANVLKFATQHELDAGALNKLLNFKAKSHKGWTRAAA